MSSEEDAVYVFRWLTNQGKIMRMSDMHTGHIFNAAKMLFNHLSSHIQVEPVWFKNRHYTFEQMAAKHPTGVMSVILTFIAEIERRNDLPDKYIDPYRHIIAELRKKDLIL